MKTFILTLFTFFTFTLSSHLLAQNVAINATGSNADASAMLDVSSTTSGFLLPRLTTAQQNSITLPAKGLTIFNTSLNSIMLNIGTPLSPNWSPLAAGAIDTSSIANFSIKVRSLTTASAPITFTNGQIGITQSGTSTNGYLSSTDWNIFNNKGSGTVTSIATGYGLSGGTINTTGTLTADSAVLSNYYLRRKDSSVNRGYYPYATNPKNYLTSNQTITLSGDISGTGTTAITTTLPTVNGNVGTWNNVTVNSKGLVTAASNISYLTSVDTSNISSFSTKVRSLFSATAPITYSNGLIGITQASTSTNGYLNSTDWNTFNNKANTADVWKVLGNSGTNSGINFIGTIDNKSFRFRTNNVERMIIDSLGNVGIGTSGFDATQPEKLLVDAGTHANNGPVINSTPINAVGASNGFQQVQVQNKSWGNYSSSDFAAASDGTRNGTVAVNTDLHYVDLGINSSGYTNSNSNILNQQYTPYLYSTAPQDFYIGNGYSGRSLIFFTNSGPTNANNTADGSERMRIASNGNIGIGTTSTGTYKLNVSGDVNASGGYTQASDIRLKKNIENLTYGLNEVLSLRPVRYNWKDSSHLENKIGFIAQEVRKLVPEVVQGDESKETIGMNYSELVPVLVNAIKEQQQQIDDLKKDIQLLKSKK